MNNNLTILKICVVFILLIAVLSFANCKTAPVRFSEVSDFSFLNGVWIKPCDSLLTGDYKGEIECDIIDDEAIRHIISITNNKGTIVRKLSFSEDTVSIAFQYDSAGRLILEHKSHDYIWKQRVHKVDGSTLKLYSKDSSSISFFERIP